MDEVALIPYTIENPMLTFISRDPGEYGRQINYYHGNAFINGVENVDVTFIVQQVDSAVVIPRFLLLKSVKHNRVMHPHFYTTYHNLFLVCYDKIESFLSQDLIRDSRVKKPIDGQPDEITACDIRELSMGLEEVHKNNLCFFNSEYPSRYVISKEKIKFCNIDLYAKVKNNDTEWDIRLKKEIENFGKLITWLLDIGVSWPEKNSFLQCFKHLTLRSCRDLRVIYTHPFLIRNKKYAVQILEDAYHALSSTDDDVREYKNLKTLVWNTKLSTMIIGGNIQWLPDQRLMHPKFLKILRYVDANRNNTGTSTSAASSSTMPNHNTGRPTPRINKQPQKSFQQSSGNQSVTNIPKHNYKGESINDLIKFVRHVYQHYYTGSDKISIGEVYDEIKKHWPKLIDTIHVASWT